MKNNFLYSSRLFAAGLGFMALAACSDMNSTQQRVLSGGAIGAGAGIAGEALTGGCVTCGAAIGAGVGAVGGYIYDQSKK